jgi:glycyl-tRNA synthetase beta chain
MPDLLFEIGLEEIPARMIPSAEAELLRRTLAMLGKENLLPETFDPLAHAQSFTTPRRLAVLIHGVLAHQADITEEVTGPATKIAYKDGLPTPAAEAFAKKNGIAVTDLRTIKTPKGEYLAATTVKKGRSASEVIASELPKEIAAIYWAKSMYWRAGKPERFVRPVMWMVCLLGDSVVPVTFGGKTADRRSFGHRVLSRDKSFEIKSPQSYLSQLEGEFVLADVEARRHKIRKALDKVTRAVPGARWREDEALVDTVTHLTEWPDVLLGDFEAAYLELPEEVLVTVMRDHQKYFAVEDAAGKLAPHFLAVVNIALDEKNAAIIKQGNERVLRARFNDARFFWEFDQRTPLTERVKLLENVTFQKDLGSYAAKSKRVEGIAQNLATLCSARGKQLDEAGIGEAARLAKTDLTTELVKEFTELQGIIGGLYARKQTLSAVVADAIYDQYLPASADDAIPRSAEGAVLGLADRIDNIAGMFGLGMEPTGSKDPFALRRAGNAIVRILAESELPLLLSDIFSSAQVQPEVKAKLDAFFTERVDFYLREARGQAYDVVKAVMAPGYEDIRDAVARAEAVTAARGSEDFLAVSAAFKRMKNILAQADFHLDSGTAAVANDGTPERNLHRKYAELVATVGELLQSHAYREALEAIATIRSEIDAFFEKVMIMDPDLELRHQRLFLLATILKSFSSIADFSEIVVS